MSVYLLSEMPIQSCGQSVSAPRGKAGASLNAHTELRAKRQRSAWEAIYRNRPIGVCCILSSSRSRTRHTVRWAVPELAEAGHQGLTLVNLSAQRKHFLRDVLGGFSSG